MGTGNSKEKRRQRSSSSSFRSASASSPWASHQSYPQYGSESYNYPPPPSYAPPPPEFAQPPSPYSQPPPSQSYGNDTKKRLERNYSYHRKNLSRFDEDNLIPCYGFGDASTHDQDVFSFNPEDRFCNGFEEVLGRYKEIVPQLKLAGPTSFAPIIDMAMTIVEQSGGQYHVLVIIADGQVTRSVDTENGQLSPQELKTVDAIVQASKLPLSIVLVGVGDGPWDMMREFDDNIPARAFDNFQFVNFTEIMSKNKAQSLKETEFALSALMEIPQQYKATLELSLLGRRNGKITERFPLPPPMDGGASSYNKPKANRVPSFKPSVPSYPSESYPVRSSSPAPPATTSASDNQICPICLTSPKDMAFGCGHQCGPDLQVCPICRAPIQTRIKLY
ncbi:hypothetical protein Bca52824_050958 [Brassica carinata]|uniref:Copine C-terminal domain-containing protein n=1 Tax=Brassica carinata TaxID=52824 RepID=A0A8X7R4K4_BRACI|nr:hypothetical protein Bca52824_050958 [Brassica carinata]